MIKHVTSHFFACLFFFAMPAFIPSAPGVVSAPPELADSLKKATDQQAGALLVGRIDAIQKGETPTATKPAVIADLIAQAIDALGDRSPAVLAGMVGNLNHDALSIVTAAAVIVTGTKSPAIIKQMSAGLPEGSEKLDLITAAASDPGGILDKETITRIAPPLVSRKKLDSIITVNPSAVRYEGQK
ncbi:MAG: hypothetical protein RRC34_07775 [Lentisphaeria bacterium]|nr:hypothetical protein [Lentisphaeria bacterium]